MRNDKIGGKNLKKDYDVYTLYEINGLNLDGLVNFLQKKGVGVYRVKKIGAKTLRIGIKFCDDRKFFAICNDLWYTDIKKVKEYGKAFPLFFLLRNFGLFIGAVFFICSAAFASDLVLNFEFKGTGAICKREVQEYLSGRGVKKFSRFSDVNLKTLANDVLADNPRLTFVSLSKDGNRLIIDLALKENGQDVIFAEEAPFLSDVNGVIKEIRVFRGTAVKNVGDEVRAGDVIVEPFSGTDENRVGVSVLCYAVIECEYVYEYVSEKDGEEEVALIYAEASLGERVTEQNVIKTPSDGNFIYKAILKYRRILYSGKRKE